jgi:hypothetical protein
LSTDGKATYGYAEKAGAWDINLGSLEPASPRVLNQKADDVTQAFVEAFAELGTMEYAEGTFTEVAEDGRITAVWGEVPLVGHEGRFRPVADADVGSPSERKILSSIMLVYTVTVIHAGPDEDSKPLSDGLYFHYDSDLSGVVGDLATSNSAFARVDSEVDPWLDAPLHGGRFLDNRGTAAVNRPRLEKALRRWESAMGKPIDHVTSVPYQNYVDRYGFRPGGEPDPPDA